MVCVTEMCKGSLSLPMGAADAARVIGRSLLGEGTTVRERAVGGVRVASPDGVTLGSQVRAVCLIGAFDGLHLGHRALLAAALADARARGVPCVAVTFSPDPAELLAGPAEGRALLSVTDRVRGLLSCGADAVVVFPFTEELARTDERDFVERVLLSVVRPVWVHVGSNFRFGYRGAGDTSSLARLGEQLGFGVTAHELVCADGGPVSATRIRGLLRSGGEDSLAEAARLLGRLPFVRGTIKHGRGQGTGFGFPTANLSSDPRTCMPGEGVYACYFVLGSSAWPAAVNVGAPPTFSAPEEAFLEANLIGFSGDIYGERASVVFVRWLRASRRFDTTEELERVVLGNIDWVRSNLGAGRVEVAFDK